MRVGELEVHASGLIWVMHPDVGMGVVFIQKTAEQRQEVEKFIQALMDSNGVIPELLVEPDGLEPPGSPLIRETAAPENEDPLLDLFYNKSDLPTMEFIKELRKQRRSDSVEQESTLPA